MSAVLQAGDAREARDALPAEERGVHDILAELTKRGCLRRLGPVFARFIAALDPVTSSDALLVACALLTELESRGHSCMLLDELCADGAAMMAWTPEQWELLSDAVALPGDTPSWCTLLRACSQVREAGAPDAHEPLVLDAGRLYLRRYWNDEASVAQAVSLRALQERKVDPEAVKRWLDLLFSRRWQQRRRCPE